MKEENIEQTEQIISLGQKLANQRKKLGLTEHDIASKIHIRTSIIFDIENDNVPNVPPIFLKGYIKNYATIVNLPESEYISFIESQQNHSTIQTMKNYSNKEQKKRNDKRLVLASLFIILIIIGIISFFAWKDSQNELVEVTHYISQPSSTNS